MRKARPSLTAIPAAYPTLQGTPVSAARIEAAKASAEHEAIGGMFDDERPSLTKKSATHDETDKNCGHGSGKPFRAPQATHSAAPEQDDQAAAAQDLEPAAITTKWARTRLSD
jgi:hypothetical protein